MEPYIPIDKSRGLTALSGNPTGFKGTTNSFNADNQNTANLYDGNGNPTTYKSNALTFDPENRLTSYGTTETSAFNGDGLRVRVQYGSSSTRYFLYDGDQRVSDYTPSSPGYSYVWTFGPDGLVSRQNRAPSSMAFTYFTYDERGNVAQRSAAGSADTSDLFDAYGTSAAYAPGQNFVGFGAQWGYYNDATGLILCTNRYYDPSTGRFLTRDPIGYDGGINLYGYTANNPVNGIDPSGTDDIDNIAMSTFTGIGIVTGGTLGAGTGGVTGFGVGAIPGAIVGAGAGGAAGAATGLVFVGLRHAVLNWMSGPGGGVESGPESSGGPYSHLQDPPDVGPGKPFTQEQKETIYRENMQKNNGILRDDETGEELKRVGPYKGGQKLPANAAQIDHIIPRVPSDPTVAPGTNSYRNARVVSRVSNRAKSNSCPIK